MYYSKYNKGLSLINIKTIFVVYNSEIIIIVKFLGPKVPSYFSDISIKTFNKFKQF